MKLTNLRNYVADMQQWHLNKYGKLDWLWYDEGLIYAIQDYYGMKENLLKMM